MQKFLKIILTSLLLAPFMTPVAGAEDGPGKPAKLFKDNSRLQVTLKGPWRSMARRPANTEKYPGELIYTDENGEQHTFNIGITTRGLTRRTVCDFPPVKLWFDKDQLKGTAFRGQGSLKMVTHCKSSKGVEQYYIKEYLSYRIYILITPYSFRARSMTVSYVDSERNAKPIERFGFLIEDVDDVAKRNDLIELEIPKVSRKKLDLVETSNYMLFQYLISNLDWSAISVRDPVECCYNTTLIGKAPDATPVYSIPYDLDASGLVDAHYAAPPDALRVNSVRTRLYRGFCGHNETRPDALARFMDQKQNILDLFAEEELLTPSSRNKAVRFLEGFYTTLAKPGAIDKRLIGKCRG